MKRIKFLAFTFIVAVFFSSCEDDIESPNLTEDERNLIRHVWQGEGVYLQDVKLDSAVSRISLEFNSRSAGIIKDVSVNGFIGGSWELNGRNLTIKYPTGFSTDLDSVILNISRLTETELNLTTSREVRVFDTFILSPEAELRLIPKP